MAVFIIVSKNFSSLFDASEERICFRSSDHCWRFIDFTRIYQIHGTINDPNIYWPLSSCPTKIIANAPGFIRDLDERYIVNMLEAINSRRPSGLPKLEATYRQSDEGIEFFFEAPPEETSRRIPSRLSIPAQANC